MSPLMSLLKHPPLPLKRQLPLFISALIGLFLTWSAFAHLEEFTIATGEVVPQEQIQTVQHLEGGIIENIHVREGSRVEKGQELVQLNITSFVANKEELQVNLQGLHLKKARLEAQARGEQELAFPQEMDDYRAALVSAELRIFEGKTQEMKSTLSLLNDQLEQAELDVTQLRAEKTSIQSNVRVLREKMRISYELMKDKLTSKLDHLQLKSELQELEGRLEIINVAIPRSEAGLKEAKERLVNQQVMFRNEFLNELSAVEMEIARTQEMLARANDQVLRTTIKSPIDGIVKSLKTHTIGGVVQPGEAIMEIVPTSNNLIIEARLDPKDVGFVREDQPALVKMETYDYARFGGLDGKVISISADSHIDEKTGDPYFEVVVVTDRNYLGKEPGQLPITAGMQAMVDIQTGSKSVIQYLLKPVIHLQQEAFRER